MVNRSRARLRRNQGSRTPALRVLVVCEGKKTEKNYFEDLGRSMRLTSLQFRVVPPDWGTSPDKIVTYAKFLVQHDTWDEVYCVFDRDDHEHFASAIQWAKDFDKTIRNSDRRVVRFVAIPSNPSFELWFLAHFALLTSDQHRDSVLKMLIGKMGDYSKNLPGMWQRLEGQRPSAMANAKTMRARAVETGNPNPSTDVDILVARLLSLKS